MPSNFSFDLATTPLSDSLLDRVERPVLKGLQAMGLKKTKFIVGLFVASGIAIASLAIIWLGMSRFLEKGKHYVTYFNESVQGLNRDAPVKYRGVPIGRVESIRVAPDGKLIEVVLKIEEPQTLDKDIVTQLMLVGITGSMFIELDRKKEGEPDFSPHLSFPAKYPVVASKPSDIRKLFRGLDDVLTQIKALNLGGISDNIRLTLDNINQMIADADIKGLSTNLNSALESINHTLDIRRWDKIVVSLEEAGQSLNVLMEKGDRSLNLLENSLMGVKGIVAENRKTINMAIGDFRLAVKNANDLFQKGSSLVSGTDNSLSHIRRHLLVVAQNLEKASENLSLLIDLITDQPSQLVFGEPPVPRKVESKNKKKP